MPPTSVKDATLVRSDEQLSNVVAAAREAGRMGLDTEFLREKTYRARLCLVQVSIPDAIYLIDPLEALDLKPLAEVLGDPEVEVIVHAGKQDFELLEERFGVVPSSVLDVQVAAGFIGLAASLAYGALVSNLLDVKLQKGEAYSDWCKRPLSESQLRYAADDVRWLLPLADALERKLDDLGRREWVREEMKSYEDPDSYGVDAEESWRRVTGRGTLSPRQVAVLREVAKWREETAARRDLPRGWLVKDPTLVEIARRTPDSIQALKQIRGINAKEAERSGSAILAAIEKGKKAAPIDTPKAPPKRAQIRARMLSGLADAVVRSRCDKAEIATELVATRGELEAVLTHLAAGSLEPEHHRLLRGWRRELAGDPVLRVAGGEIALRATDRPPYVEEVELEKGGDDGQR
jgi:ribonuclease D